MTSSFFQKKYFLFLLFSFPVRLRISLHNVIFQDVMMRGMQRIRIIYLTSLAANLCARTYFKYFTNITSFSPHCNSMRQILSLCPFSYWSEAQRSSMTSSCLCSLKVVVRVGTKAVWLESLYIFHYIMLPHIWNSFILSFLMYIALKVKWKTFYFSICKIILTYISTHTEKRLGYFELSVINDRIMKLRKLFWFTHLP